MALSSYCKERILQHCFGRSKTWKSTSHFYFGLTSGDLLEDGSNISVEVSGDGYTRKIYQNYSVFWDHPDSGTMYSLGYIQWTAGEDWGNISGFFIADNSTIGESSGLIAMSLFDTPKVISNDDTLSLSVSGIKVTIS